MESYRVLTNEVKIPSIGFGTYKLEDESETRDVIKYALKIGYRFIDTASFYGNEESIGRAIKESEVRREDIFLSTKVWNDKHGYDKAIKSFEESMRKLDIDYLDLLLVNWPTKFNSETWKAFEDLYELGNVRAIGVCNFKIKHLEALRKTAKIMPMVNQIEIHPQSSKNDMLSYCEENNIQLVAWSPIMRGKLFSNELMIGLAEKYKKTIAQIILRWHLQRGVIPIPKSSNEERIKENLNIFDFELSNDDIKTIDLLNEGDNVSVSGVPENTTYLKF